MKAEEKKKKIKNVRKWVNLKFENISKKLPSALKLSTVCCCCCCCNFISTVYSLLMHFKTIATERFGHSNSQNDIKLEYFRCRSYLMAAQPIHSTYIYLILTYYICTTISIYSLFWAFFEINFLILTTIWTFDFTYISFYWSFFQLYFIHIGSFALYTIILLNSFKY